MKLLKTLAGLILCATIASLIVILLFIYSERKLHTDNNFTRRFLPYAVKQETTKNIRFNSHYFAGISNDRIFLANVAAPSLIDVYDNKLKKLKGGNINLVDADSIPFQSIQVKIKAPHFFVLDGTVPCIFRGKISDWKGYPIPTTQLFSVAAIIDSSAIAFRTFSPVGENILGRLDLVSNAKPLFAPTLLQKQLDGIFDTDGSLSYSKTAQYLIYTYSYRNQFVVADNMLRLKYRGKTIDTTSKADLKIATLKSKNVRKFAAPPHTVNAETAVHGDFLLVNSALRGRFEMEEQWNNSTVIDIYNLSDRSYRFSFYIPDINGKKMSRFAMNETHFFALVDTYLVAFKLGPLFYTNSSHKAEEKNIGGLKAPR